VEVRDGVTVEHERSAGSNERAAAIGQRIRWLVETGRFLRTGKKRDQHARRSEYNPNNLRSHG